MTKIKLADLGALMLKRAKLIQQMEQYGLSLDHLKEFSEDCLLDCCQRLSAYSLRIDSFYKNLQREAIQNQAFAALYADCLSQFPDKEENSVLGITKYEMSSRLDELTEFCRDNDRPVTQYSLTDILEVLAEDVDSCTRLVYLENFTDLKLSDEERRGALSGIYSCKEVPLHLDEKQRALLQEPFVRNSDMSSSTPFQSVFQLLDSHPALLTLARIMYKKRAGKNLYFSDYRRFAQDEQEYCSLLDGIVQALEAPVIDMFLWHWHCNDCPLHELQALDRLVRERTERDWMKLFGSRSGYINTLYGKKFKNLDLSSLGNVQDNILMYAISHRKKHFIRMVDEHTEEFLAAPDDSLLFQEEFYEEHFNINELTVKELTWFAKMAYHRWQAPVFAEGRQYTFTEIRVLYGQREIYWRFYNELCSTSQDVRLRVFREIKKRDLLSLVKEDEIPALAYWLNIKPLSQWRQNEFGHIEGLQAGDVVRLLAHYKVYYHLIPDMQTRVDAQIAFRSRNVLTQFDSMQGLKENLMETDPQWRELSGRLELTPEFIREYKEEILDFLSQNGAEIAMTYMGGLNERYQRAFQRVVKAQLMGKFYELKYFEGDLKRELDIPLTNTVVESWKENTQLVSQEVSVQEHDDFFSTMLAGEEPRRTCLSYCSGVYRDCLLAGFDSNKKLLYAQAAGKTVGRAFLRFTKARVRADMTDPENGNKLTFVDLEASQNENSARNDPEPLALFLERPYIGRAGAALEKIIRRQFVQLAQRKAAEMGVMLVLSRDYNHAAAPDFTLTRLNLYVSRSKAGQQYLDSLGGSASVTSEGSYRANTFLVGCQPSKG